MTTPETSIAKKKIPFSFAKRHRVLVEKHDKHKASITYVPPLSLDIVNELRRYLECPLALHETTQEELEKKLTITYQQDSRDAMQAAHAMGEEINLQQVIQSLPKSEDLLAADDDAPIIRLLNALLGEAIQQKASDVHIETFSENFVFRFRIDGVLREIMKPAYVLAPLIVSRIKVMAKLDIAEKRLPQDGRISLNLAGREVDVRVSTIPTQYGERIVLRLLDKQATPLNLSELGIEPNTLGRLEKLIQSPHGIILITGPTGSGKTTTLYGILNQLNQDTHNILTIEDPIEYYLSGVGQMQVNAKIDMSFSRGLRAILRQDPDIVMVGEIRDKETAEIAIQASLTGHLVLSTLHTNSAVGAIARLQDMQIESFLLASSLIGLAAQRLIRLLCPHCKEAYPANETEGKLFEFANATLPITLYRAKGCEKCFQIGYRGRSAIYELIILDDSVRNLIQQEATQQQLTTHIRKNCMSIQQDGLLRVLKGETSLDEVFRITGQIH